MENYFNDDTIKSEEDLQKRFAQSWFEFTDLNGERHVSRGDNGYIQDAVRNGIPLSITDEGEWYTRPYIEQTQTGLVAHIPNWFKETDDYTNWQKIASQIPTMGVTQENVDTVKDILKYYGNQALTKQQERKTAADYGLTDPTETETYVNDYLAIINEGANNQAAKLSINGKSVKETAQEFKNLSKEELSDRIKGYQRILNARGQGQWTQQQTREALTLYKLLNIVADNPTSFGEEGEFNGLLEASEWQKFLAHNFNALQTIAEGAPLLNFITRGLSGIGSELTGGSFGQGWKLENLRTDENSWLNSSAVGTGLRGTEGSIVSGQWAGSLANMALTVAETAMIGSAIGGATAAAAPGTFLSTVGHLGATFGGSMIYDFVVNDLPIDLSLFAVDLSSGKSQSESWESRTEKQPLFGLFGPDVPAGLKYNLIGDAILDVAIPVAGIANRAMWSALDNATGGSVTKMREAAKIGNLKIQEGISNLPVIGTGLKKFSNAIFGAENAALIREARKKAILEGSMTPYTDIQNLITLKNHFGAEVVAPMYRKLVDELGITDSIKEFKKNANNWGGMGKTSVKWDEASAGIKKQLSETINDDLPTQVKRGLLDYQRLEELKGEVANEAELLSNPKRAKEIAELEKRVENLDPKIKDFAQRFSELNKRVEYMAAQLGLKTTDWVDALNADPRWKNYMTRQVLLPGGIRGAGAYDPTQNKILTGSRTGFYNPKQTLTPTMALDMKVHAIGNAYAWNERAKALVSAEITQGKIVAGTAAPDIAKRITEKRAEIAAVEATNAKLGYDAITKGFSDRIADVRKVIANVNEGLSKFENLNSMGVFTRKGSASVDPKFKSFQADFNTGKVKVADDALAALDLSADDLAHIVSTTYSLKKEPTRLKDKSVETPKAPEVPKVKVAQITTPLLGQDKPKPFTSTLFHGSGKTKAEIYNGAQVPVIGEGKYWAFDEESAKEFGDKIEKQEITLNAPLRITSDDDFRELTRAAGWKFPNTVGIDEATMAKYAQDFKDMVVKAGYDGVIVSGVVFNGFNKPENKLLRNMFGTDQVVVYGSAKPVTEAPELAGEAAKAATYGRGFDSNGYTYKYKLDKDNNIEAIEQVTDPIELAEALDSWNQGFRVRPEDIEKWGVDNVADINRAMLFYQDNGFNIDDGNQTRFHRYYKSSGIYGWSSETVVKVENGRVILDPEFNLIGMNGAYWLKENREDFIASRTRCSQLRADGTRFHPMNTTLPQFNTIHERAHNLMKRIAVALYNKRNFDDVADDVRKANIKQATDAANTIYSWYEPKDLVPTHPWTALAWEVVKIEDEISLSIIDEALAATGDKHINKALGRFSGYSVDMMRKKSRPAERRAAEAIADAFADYAANGVNADKLSIAIVDGVKRRLEIVQPTAFDVRKAFQDNALDLPDKLLKKSGEYAFPASAKTNAAKAKWLDDWRQKNPYLKGTMTEDTYVKANVWDSLFQNEIRALDPLSTSTAPAKLADKASAFVENMRKQQASDLMTALKSLPGGFDEDLAMAIIGGNGEDIAKSIDNFIIKQVQISAEDLAKNMEGGATPDNINTALITLWSDSTTKEAVQGMLNELVPQGPLNVQDKVNTLFDQQAKGLAAYSALPVNEKNLLNEKSALIDQLYAENKRTLKYGNKLDKANPTVNGTHIIHYREGGEDVYVAVNDPVIASILEKPYNYKEHGMVSESMASIANFVATTYRLGTTGINPLAIIKNMIRDPLQAIFTAGFNPLSMTISPEYFYKTLAQYGLDDETIGMVMGRIRNWANASTLTQEMRLGPGKASYSNRVEKFNNDFRKFTGNKIFTAMGAPLETWEGYFRNQVGQQSFMKNFQRTGDVDKALSSALFDTSNATTNFSHALGKFRNVTSTIPYLSSAVNGSVSFWRLFNADPIGMVGRITAGFMLPVMAITMWNLSSEENRKVYKNLPDWYKDGHVVLVDPQGNVVALPLPDEIANFAGVARRLIEYTNDASPYSLGAIAAQGAFGFLPFSVDGYFGEDGSINFERGTWQMLSGIMPQAFTAMYEWIFQEDLYTGQDLSGYNTLNKLINLGSNVFGTGFKQVANSIGLMCGASSKDLVGISMQETLAREYFGLGFKQATNQFMAIIGNKAQLQEDGTMSKATGLFKENEELKAKIKAMDEKIAYASESEKVELEKKKQDMIDEFVNKVKTLVDKYQKFFSITGGLEGWQKNKIVQLLTLGDGWGSSNSDSYVSALANDARSAERGLALQRYVNAGLDAGPDLNDPLAGNSIELQAALNRFYGTPKQATQDFKNAIEKSGAKDIKDKFYAVIQQIYDDADANNIQPDYDLIEKIQARYLQQMDAAIVPIIEKYGLNILNNNDFIDAVRRQVNGMIPSDDWRQSARNAKKFLSTKDFPTATVDVKKWLKQRYTSSLKDRGLDSDAEVTQRLAEIKGAIDSGNMGAAKGKVESLLKGIKNASYYISGPDQQTLLEYKNMLK